MDNGSGTIFKFAPDGTKTTFSSGLIGPTGLAFDRTGNLFVAEINTSPTNGTIVKFTPDGTKDIFVTGLDDPQGLAFDSSGNLFEADHGSGTIFKFTPDGTKTTFAVGAIAGAIGLAFHNSGNLFDSDLVSGTIFQFTPGGTKATFASGLGQPVGLAFQPTTQKLLNISTRGFVGTGDQVLIAGFILGNGVGNGTVLARALGPSLSGMGVAGAMQDPMLRLFDSNGVVINSNDNWKDTQQAAIQATGLAPTDDREAAIIASLPAGAFTGIVSGVNSTTGVALVDLFNLQ